MRIRWKLGVAAMLVALVATGCGSSGGGSHTPVENGTFTYGINYDPGSSFDPYTNLKLLQVSTLAYDTLVHVAPDGKLIPGLAEQWSATTRSATFTIRKGITCSDGTPLTAGAVAKAINFVANPGNHVVLVGLTLPLTQFSATADEAKSTVRLKLADPFSFVLEAFGRLAIVCPSGLAHPEQLAKHSEGTGPYLLDEIVPGDHLTFKRRDGYAWGPDGARTTTQMPSRIDLRVVTNDTTAANLLQSGQLNAAYIGGADAKRLQAQHLFSQPTEKQYGLLAFNQRPGRVLADQALRRALVTGLDLDELAKVATGGSGRRAPSFIPVKPSVCDYGSVAGNLPGYDPTKAKQLLTQAGWVPGPDGVRVKGGKRLSLAFHYQNYDLGSTVTSVVELMQQQLKELGVKTTLTGDDLNGSLNVLFGTGDWDIFWGEQGFQYPSDLLLSYSGSPPPTGQNFTGVVNHEVDQLAPRALSASSTRSCPVWQQIEESLIRNVNLIPVANAIVPIFGKAAEFRVVAGILEPTSIRMYR